MQFPKKKLAKVNSWPRGESSPNLVTLFTIYFSNNRRQPPIIDAKSFDDVFLLQLEGG
jgi:hypothetical protein